MTTPTTSRRGFGITWRPFGSDRTSVRGGYGIFYDTTSLGLIVNAAQINGRRILSYIVPGTDPRAPVFPNLLATGDPAFSTPPSITVFPEDFEIMFAHQASVTRRAAADRAPAGVGRLQLLGRIATRRTRTTPTSAPWSRRSPMAGRSTRARPFVPTRSSAPSTSSRASGRSGSTTASTSPCASA